MPKPPALRHGGAHNRADRQSWQLDEADCRKLINAGFAAWDAGQPLNRYITLAWGPGGIDATDSVTATGQFIRLAREWMRARGYPMPWVWVQERGATFGQHAHVLLAVPKELEPLFRKLPREWAKQILGGEYVSGVVQSQRLNFAHTDNLAAYEAQLLGKLHYMLKCTPAALEGPLGMAGRGYKEWGQSCLVIGKRSAAWQGWKQVVPCRARPFQTGEIA